MQRLVVTVKLRGWASRTDKSIIECIYLEILLLELCVFIIDDWGDKIIIINVVVRFGRRRWGFVYVVCVMIYWWVYVCVFCVCFLCLLVCVVCVRLLKRESEDKNGEEEPSCFFVGPCLFICLWCCFYLFFFVFFILNTITPLLKKTTLIQYYVNRFFPRLIYAFTYSLVFYAAFWVVDS